MLALEADGADPLPLPRGTAFRSEAFDKEPPQVFELDAATVIWPERNRWQLAPVRDAAFDGTLRFLPRRAPSVGSVILVATTTVAVAARVASVEPETGQDGAHYLRAVLEGGSATLATLAGAPLGSITVSILRLSLGPTSFGTAFTSLSANNQAEIVLDALYPQVRRGARAALEIAKVLHSVTIDEAIPVPVEIDSETGAKMTVTQVTISPNLSYSTSQSLVFHADPFPLGSPTRPAKTAVSLADLQASGSLVPPVKPLGEAPAGGPVILIGARQQGALLSGAIVERGHGAARFEPDAVGVSFDVPLSTPVELYGNVVEAIRGETVIGEPLGSANAAEPFNSFILKKKPLVWREDSSQPQGRRPDLTVRVNGIEWTRVDTFFGQKADAQVYTVRQQPDGTSRITFGDGKRGARPASGVDNVEADYRHGAGAAKPPAGTINQIAVPVKGLATVRGALAATGGADAEGAEELRTSAPAGALTIGRAVSIADFEALARSYAGVVNASAGWIWDERRQRAAAKLWIIAEGGAPAEDLTAWLAGQATPDLVIVVAEAAPAQFTALSITLQIAPRHDPDVVREAARAALFARRSGLLDPARQSIGAPLFRSALTHQLHQVSGVASVVSILIDGLPMPAAISPGVGRYFDLAANSVVG
jgi:predicted phage baseplate assembly protein